MWLGQNSASSMVDLVCCTRAIFHTQLGTEMEKQQIKQTTGQKQLHGTPVASEC